MSFGEENVGRFTIVNISYFSEPGIWLGKILANGVRFAKSAKFPLPKFALYGMLQEYWYNLQEVFKKVKVVFSVTGLLQRDFWWHALAHFVWLYT